MLSFRSFLSEMLLTEGGAGGHIKHPFDIASNGQELLDVFEEAVAYIKSGKSSVKIDGVNSSLRLVNGQFVLDRGTAKPLDIKGIRPEDLESRFGTGHGFIEKGKKILEIFDTAYPSIRPELKKLGMVDNPNILLNVEYVGGKTNVVDYKKLINFNAIHGLKLMKLETKDGKTKSRTSEEIPYDSSVMQRLVQKLDKVATKFEFRVLGNVDVELKEQPNFKKVTAQEITLNGETKTLGAWLAQTKIETPLITRKEYSEIMKSDKTNLTPKQMSDYIVYTATILLGNEILKNASSKLGDLSQQEGVVVKRKDGTQYKITGSFILRGMQSTLGK